MDSKDDEQARGITMKSSSISLLYVPGAATLAEGPSSVSRADRLEQGGWVGGGGGGVCGGDQLCWSSSMQVGQEGQDRAVAGSWSSGVGHR